jgi:uncharacterized membrane protein
MNELTAYHPLPKPSELTEREKEDAMGGYLMMFASIAAGLPLPVVNLIASVIYYYMNRNKSRFIHFHSLQSLLTQIPISLLNATFVFFTINNFIVQEVASAPAEYIYFAVVVALSNLIYFIFSIVAAIKARKGRMYYFVFFGKLCYNKVYSKASALSYSEEPENDINLPPN